MRGVSVFVLLLLSFQVVGPLAADSRAESLSPAEEAPEYSTSPLDEEPADIDDALLQLLLEEPKLCCKVAAIDPNTVPTLAGLLFWARI